jgi:hypothetical protein
VKLSTDYENTKLTLSLCSVLISTENFSGFHVGECSDCGLGVEKPCSVADALIYM